MSTPPDRAQAAAFVQSCVAFTTNVQFTLSSALPASKAPTAVLLLSREGDEAATAYFAALLPTLGFEGSAWVGDLVRARNTSFTTVLPPGNPALVSARIATVASRHNCALRPDLITKAVADAVAEAAGGAVSVVVSEGLSQRSNLLAIAQAVAKGANRSFTAKAGAAERAFLSTAAPVVVYLHTVAEGARLAALSDVALAIQLCMRLVDAPTNLLDTVTFTNIATQLATARGCRASVIAGEDLRMQGYGGVYGVGKAAEFPPALVSLSYAPAASTGPKVAFVGKGIVYDTGGLAIKTPATGMCTMKCDMGGAAAVLCGFLALAAMGATVPIDCVLCLADNAIGPLSQRNDDIVVLKSGLTIEINNTDAEGRLVLSDGVFHAASLMGDAPAVVLDMATLTGAQGICTGQAHAAVMTTTDDWEARAVAAGRACGDLLFPILYCPEFLNPEFHSKVADHRNSVRNRSNAQTSCAGQFIANSLPKSFGGAFVHVDLAGPAFRGEVATGFGVALLVQLFGTDRI